MTKTLTGALTEAVTGAATEPATAMPRALIGLTAFVAILDCVIVGPLAGHGSLQLLDIGDYPAGPHPPPATSAFGFPPGVTSRAPVNVAIYWIFGHLHWSALHLTPLAAVAPLACIGFSRLFSGRPVAAAAATLLFTVNPFIYERMANGQMYVVMGYSLLPLLLALVFRPLASLAATSCAGGIILATSVACSVHYLFIAGAMLIAGIAVSVPLRARKAALAAIGTSLCGAMLSLYWLIPAASDSHYAASHVTKADLSVFQTASDGLWGLGVNILGLYGFWRPGPPLVKNELSGWTILLFAILAIAAFGLHQLWGADKAEGPGKAAAGRALALWCLVIAITACFLAAGTHGMTGGLYNWMFAHIPGFKVMREPQKFSALLALAYAAGFGSGAETITLAFHRKLPRILCACCLAAIPVSYGYTELWGFLGYARPTQYPAAWAAADRMMKPGASMLALPWRTYLTVPWIGNRVVYNPMASYFDRPVVSADGLEAGPIDTETSDPRSRFVQFCLSQGRKLTEFGRLLAPLGLRYVAIAKVPGAGAYDWLARQHDLRLVFASRNISLYENTEQVLAAYQPRQRLRLSDWGAVAAFSQRSALDDYLITVRHARPGPLRIGKADSKPNASPKPLRTIARTSVSETVADIGRGLPIVLTSPAYAGWRLPGYKSIPQFGVTVAFLPRALPPSGARVRPRTAQALYGPWRLVWTCDVLGGSLLLIDVMAFCLATRRARS